MPIADCALQSKQLSSLATARPTGEPTETPTRSTRDAAGAFQRARSIGLVPHTLSTAHTHFGLTSKVWRLTAKSCGAGRNLQNSEKKWLGAERGAVRRFRKLRWSTQRVTLGTPTSTSDWSLGDKKPQHPGWAHTTVGPRPGPRAPGRAPPPVARLPGLPGCPLRELELGNTTCPPCPQKGKVAIFPSRRRYP